MIQTPSSILRIKEIENNLKSITSQIKILGRSQVHNIKSIQKCFDDCVPLLKSKIQESQNHLKIKRMYQGTLYEKQNRILDIQLKKYDDMRKKTNIKSLIFSIKHKQANEIRQQSIKHNQLMRQKRSKYYEEKVKKSQKIKNQEIMTKQKIKSFHKQKIQDISRIKKKQQEEKIDRIKRSSKLMEKINQQKILTHSKYNETHASLKKLRFVVKKIKLMRPEEFSQIINQTFEDSLTNDQSLNSRLNQTMLSEMNSTQSPIYSGKSRFIPKEQLITSKLINRLLESNQTEQESSS